VVVVVVVDVVVVVGAAVVVVVGGAVVVVVVGAVVVVDVDVVVDDVVLLVVEDVVVELDGLPESSSLSARAATTPMSTTASTMSPPTSHFMPLDMPPSSPEAAPPGP